MIPLILKKDKRISMERDILNSGLIAMISLQLRGQLQKGQRQSNHMEKTRDNGYMLHWGQFHLDMRIFFFFCFLLVRTIIQWNNLLRNVIESLLLEVFEMQ